MPKKELLGINMQWLNRNAPGSIGFAYDNDENDIGISKGLATQWCAKKPNESVKTRRNRVQIIRVFSAYLCSVGYQSYVPQMPRAKSTFIPLYFFKG